LDFADLSVEFFETAIFAPAKINRLKAIGKIDKNVIAVIFALLGTEGISIVSMRPASKPERKGYAEQKETGPATHH
jgi:uncharacterized protein